MLGTSYLGYFGVLTYAAITKIRTSEDNHLYVTASTLTTAISSCTIMLFNGQVSQRMHPILFMSLYTLFNLYIWFIGYAYSPCLGPDSAGGAKVKHPGENPADATTAA